LATPSAILTWNEEALGRRLRDEMKRSAESGSSGLPQDDAVAIWTEVDGRAADDRHTRSLYHRYRQLRPDVARWVDSEYLKNLPHLLDLGLSLPRSAVRDYGLSDPLVEPVADVADSEVVRGRDCVLFSSWFLGTLGTRDIERLRSLDEFKTFTAARYAGTAIAARTALLGYLRAVGKEAPRIVDPSIRSLEAQVRVKWWLGRAATPVGIILLLTAGGANPLLSGMLALAGLFLQRTSDTEKLVGGKIEGAKDALQARRQASEFLADFCHDSALQTIGPRGRRTR
jgi:hypothetical protein